MDDHHHYLDHIDPSSLECDRVAIGYFARIVGRCCIESRHAWTESGGAEQRKKKLIGISRIAVHAINKRIPHPLIACHCRWGFKSNGH